MKSKDGESRSLLPLEPDSAENGVLDFLYVDKARVSALYAQLFPQGTLTAVKTTSQQGSAGFFRQQILQIQRPRVHD